LPDIATLTQLANSFFASLPGQAPTPIEAAQAPAAVPSAGPVAAGSGVTPSVSALPSAPPSSPGVGGANGSTPSLSDFGRAGPASFAVPVGYGAGLPELPQPARPPQDSASGYYFLAESGALFSRAGPNVPATPPLPIGDDAVVARSFGLPSEDSLRDLLSESPRQPAAPVSAAPATPSSFYFLDGDVPRLDAAPDATPRAGQHSSGLDVQAVRRDFPILAERVNGKPLIWLDNAATTHKPQAVIDRLAYFYQHENSNIHRAAHELAARATDAYEAARQKVARFIGAASPDEIIFVRGATEAINLVANTWGQQNIGAGDEIVVSQLEHHANIVPWQLLAQRVGATIRVIPVDDSGQILLDEYRQLLNSRTKLVAITQVSNALGTITPVETIVALAHAVGARVLVDGAQSVSHMRVNVQAIDADFFVFSGHKVFAPTGIGAVYGKAALLEAMPPWQGGGNMIADVTFEKTVYQPAPNRFEAGTGNIADAVGLGAAIDYVESIGIERIAQYEHDLLGYATHGLQSVPGLRLIGTAQHKASVLSFVLPGYRTEEIGAALNREGIAVRSGHHCAQPILRRFGLEATVRPSLAFYNTCEEVDALVAVVKRLAHGKR
jgi:cysteine desulfurase/selenocysteine lyase